jgi:transposase
MVDLTRDQDGCLHARLLDAVVGRSGSVYKAWLKAQPDGFIDGVEQAALDPFRGYTNAIHDGLPEAVAVLDAFHVVRLGTQVEVNLAWQCYQQPRSIYHAVLAKGRQIAQKVLRQLPHLSDT